MEEKSGATLKEIDIVFVWYDLGDKEEPLSTHIFNNRLSIGDIHKFISSQHPGEQVYIDEVLR